MPSQEILDELFDLSNELFIAKKAACDARDRDAFYHFDRELEEVWKKIHSFQ